MRRLIFAGVTAIAMVLAALPSAAATAGTTTAAASDGTTSITLHFTNLRNTRYCEIFLQNPVTGGISNQVYNTTGVDNCPTAQWNAMDPTQIAKQYNVAAVFKNGQRFWTLDQVVVRNADPTPNSFNGVFARFWGGFTSGPTAPPPYADTQVARDTQWWYAAGTLAYELISPTGAVYVLQAYSHIVDPTLTQDDLLSLGYQLNLPVGWRYQVQILNTNMALDTVNGVAHITQDELDNTYMLLTNAAGNPIPVPAGSLASPSTH